MTDTAKGRTVWLAWHGSWESRYLVGVFATRAGALAAIEEANEVERIHVEGLNERGTYRFRAEVATERDVHQVVVGS